ncbi:hypothetical protein NSB25_26710 [Acetatifactor muris]|uniref:Uncharacterized protein n=1 Tax=Acetatifactor muris TaxID=879566 RepID=A0A2K4ZPE8_9FIRM|nr:hypothetical protein [Acetatifactor muris]MCR2050826.1 hypothetical protein [Acetatifactor muris]SOY32340.1 hypothetical protein AMURIS_05098 [Acetatifactor muris]
MKGISLKNMEPLTAEERAFSADLENYNLFFKYMKINKLDQEEWYDILILHYLRAVKKYLNIPHLQQYEFGAVLFKTLDSARSNYCKSRTTQKRMPEGGVCSLNYIIDDGKGKEMHVDAWLIDKRTSVERQIISKSCFEEFWSAIDGFYWNEQMKTVASLLLEGYSKREVIEHMRIGFNDPQWGNSVSDWNFTINQLRTAFKDVYGF